MLMLTACGASSNQSEQGASKELYQASELWQKSTEELEQLKNEELNIQANLSDMAQEEDQWILVLSDEEGMNSISCYMNNQDLTEETLPSTGSIVKLSGTLSNISIDDMLGGKNLELKKTKIIQ